MPVVEARNLRTYFPIRRGVLHPRTVGYVKAVDDVSLSVPEGKTLGLVGESGCDLQDDSGAWTILRLIPATSGSVLYKGEDFFAKGVRARLRCFAATCRSCFQGPVSSLNPRMSVGSIISEPIQVHGLLRKVLATGK